jgi:hypothetical protein
MIEFIADRVSHRSPAATIEGIEITPASATVPAIGANNAIKFNENIIRVGLNFKWGY